MLGDGDDKSEKCKSDLEGFLFGTGLTLDGEFGIQRTMIAFCTFLSTRIFKATETVYCINLYRNLILIVFSTIHLPYKTTQ